MKLLTLDIETRPNLAHVWALWDQNVGLSQIVEVGTVICWAAKWHGDKKVEYRSDHHDGHEAMVKRAWELVDEADAVIGWNSRGFDMKHLGREWLLAGLPPPTGYRDIDLMLTARKRFKFASNKLDHVAQQLGVGAKVKHSGFELWRDCMADDPKAWAKMRQYNIGDVRLTEAVYDRLLPWVDNHPNRALYDPTLKGGCPRCLSMDYIIRGYRRTATRMYRRYQCNKCRGYFSGTHSVDGVHAKAV